RERDDHRQRGSHADDQDARRRPPRSTERLDHPWRSRRAVPLQARHFRCDIRGRRVMPSSSKPITLPHEWVPYDWQLDVLEARERGKDRIGLAVHRRAGKSVMMLNLLAVEAHKRVGSYAVMFPYATMARRAIWRESDNN